MTNALIASWREGGDLAERLVVLRRANSEIQRRFSSSGTSDDWTGGSSI